MAVKITLKQLNELGACGDQRKLFEETFGEEVSFKAKAQAVETAIKMADRFDFDWASDCLLEGVYQKAYEEARAPLLKAYEEARAPLLKAYEEARAPLWKAYLEAKAPLLKAYKEARAKLFAEIYFEQESKG